MNLSLRRRILLTMVPPLVLFAALGIGGVVLVRELAYRIDAILRENYDSVRAMEELNEALERIDSAYQFALAGKETEARKSHADNWPRYDKQMDVEKRNITIFPDEPILVKKLDELTLIYRQQGEQFFARPAGSPERPTDYFGKPGLLDSFKQIKDVSAAILHLNQENMEQANRSARDTARRSQYVLVGGLVLTGLAAGVFCWRLVRSISLPIEAVTRAAQAIGAGQLGQRVPVLRHDELGQLTEAFNRMSQQLSDLRRSNMRRLVRAQQTSQATIDSFPDPILVIDPEGRLELANRLACQVLGVVPTEADQPNPAWEPPESLRQPLANALHEQQPYLTEVFDQVLTFQLAGEERAYLPQIRPIRDPYGDTLGAAVVLNDVTRFRLLDRLKSDLVATASHELKTPLTSVRLAIHVLLEERVGPLEAKQVELLLDARDNTERLYKMIESLLALARLEQGKGGLQLVPEAPQALLRAAADAIAPRAEDRQISLVVEASPDLPRVAIDPARLGHALANLLDNALTYTEPRGQVTLSAEAGADGFVKLTIADTGVGIPAESLPHLFEKFFRVPEQGRAGGTGLGLAIVKEIVLAHGGEITCTSAPGKGTAFHLLLPVWKG
jgi:signal transduction histidine kinase